MSFLRLIFTTIHRFLSYAYHTALLPAFCLLLFLFCSACHPSGKTASELLNSSDTIPAPSPTPTFREFTESIFLQEVSSDSLTLHYNLAHPEAMGLSPSEVTLGSFSAEQITLGNAEAEALYTQLIQYPYTSLSDEEALTYSCLERVLSLSMSDTYSPYLHELLGPTTGFQAQLPILLAEYRFETEEDIRTYLKLLPCIYDYFKEISTFEKEKSKQGFFMNEATADKIIDQCLTFTKHPDENFLITTFEERLDNFPDLSATRKTEYLLENRSALFSYILPAYELLAETLTECKGTCKNPYGLSHFQGGASYYELMVKRITGSDRSMAELISLLESALTTHFQTLTNTLIADPTVYSSYLSLAYPETKPEKVMEYLTSACANDYPSLDCSGYQIKYIPKALEDFVSPAMYLIPPIDAFSTNVIYINPSPSYDMNTLFPTIAHEGYPGHLYQNVYALSGKISPLRYLLGPTGYDEGWATYVELESYRYAGFSDNLVAFLQSDTIFNLCLYALSDLHIQYDGYTKEELARFIAPYGLTADTADILYDLLLSEPGVYLPYAIGYLEIQELKATAKTLWGDDYSNYRFHEFFLSAGPLPYSMLQKLLR